MQKLYRNIGLVVVIVLGIMLVPAISYANVSEEETPSTTTSNLTFPVHTIKKNVDDDKAFVMLFLGDGYTSAEQSKFIEDTKVRAEALLRLEPYRQYANNINIYAMCVESSESGVTVDGVDTKDTYLGVCHAQNSRAAKIRTDIDYKSRIYALRDEVSKNVLTTSSDFTPSVSSTHIISNSTHYHGIAYQGYGFSISSLNDDGKITGSMAVHEITHEIGNVWDEYGSRTDFANVDSSSNNTADLVKWKKLLGFGGTAIVNGDYSSVVIPVNACLMRALGNYGYGLDVGGWGLCEVCRLEVARNLLSANNVRSALSTYVAYPEITTTHDAATTYPYAMNLYRIKDQVVGSYANNMSSVKNNDIEFRTIVQNVDTSGDKHLKLKLTTYDKNGNVKQTKEQSFTVTNYGGVDEQYKDIDNRVSCQSLSIKMTCDSSYDGSESILGEVIDTDTGESIATDKDLWNSYEQTELKIKYVDKDSGRDIENVGGASLFLKKNEKYQVTHPSTINGYSYVGNDSNDDIVDMSLGAQTLTYYFTKNTEPTPEVCQHNEGYTTVVKKVATCTQSGLEDHQCKLCGEIIESDVVIDKDTSKHGNLIDVEGKAATCTEAGYSAHQHCNDCDVDVGKTTIDPLGHKPVLQATIPSTCTAHGWSGKGICSVCGTTTNEGQELPLDSSKHASLVNVAAKVATCIERGYTAHQHCNDCNIDINKINTPVDANNHVNTTHINGQAPTCTEAGYSAHQHCNDCGVDVGKTTLNAKGHDLYETIVQPTCTQVGTKTTLCKNCDYSHSEEIAKLAHTYENGVCTVCGQADPDYVAPEPDPDPEPEPTPDPTPEPEPGPEPTPDPEPETFSLNLTVGSGLGVTADKVKYEVGQSAKLTIKGSVSGNNLIVVSCIKVDGVTVKIRDHLLNKSAWTTSNDVYNQIMNEEASMVAFDTVANSVSQGTVVEVNNVQQNTKIEIEEQEIVPVYRLYNSITSEHMFTTNKSEYDNFVALSKNRTDYWIGEGINWFAQKSATNVVRRLYNPALGALGHSSHYYTSDQTEIDNLVNNHGWQDDGVENQFASSGDVAIWTCYNEALGSAHHYTSSKTEWQSLRSHGWDLEEAKNGNLGVFQGIISAIN